MAERLNAPSVDTSPFPSQMSSFLQPWWGLRYLGISYILLDWSLAPCDSTYMALVWSTPVNPRSAPGHRLRTWGSGPKANR
jgi:hypothetical protein